MPLTIPHIFPGGETGADDELNDNFKTVANYIDQLENALNVRVADLAGEMNALAERVDAMQNLNLDARVTALENANLDGRLATLEGG